MLGRHAIRGQRRRKRGQGMLEYGIILAFVALVVIAGLNVLGRETNIGFCKVSGGLAQSASGGVDVWGNIYPSGGVGGNDYPQAIPNFACAQQIAAGDVWTVILKNDGTVWAFGDNTIGQLGQGNTSSYTNPVQVPGLSGIVAVAAGTYGEHALALKGDGTVWGWGWDNYFQAGVNPVPGNACQCVMSPTQVPGLTGVKSIATGQYTSYAVFANGTADAWGYGVNGGIGNGLYSNQSSPTAVTITNVSKIAGGVLFAVALRTDGSVWSWGYNSDGELGNGVVGNSATPAATSLTGAYTAIGAGTAGLAVKSDGSVWTWGMNDWGQTGQGTTCTPLPCGVFTPAQIISSGASQVSGARYDGDVLMSDGTVRSFGRTALGNNTWVSSSSPVTVVKLNGSAGSLSGIQAVAAGNGWAEVIDPAGNK